MKNRQRIHILKMCMRFEGSDFHSRVMIRLCEWMSVIVVLESCHVCAFCTVHVFLFVLKGASSWGVIRIRIVLQILGSIHWDCHKGTSFVSTQFVCHRSHGHVAYRIRWEGIIHRIEFGFGGGDWILFVIR